MILNWAKRTNVKKERKIRNVIQAHILSSMKKKNRRISKSKESEANQVSKITIIRVINNVKAKFQNL